MKTLLVTIAALSFLSSCTKSGDKISFANERETLGFMYSRSFQEATLVELVRKRPSRYLVDAS